MKQKVFGWEGVLAQVDAAAAAAEEAADRQRYRLRCWTTAAAAEVVAAVVAVDAAADLDRLHLGRLVHQRHQHPCNLLIAALCSVLRLRVILSC